MNLIPQEAKDMLYEWKVAALKVQELVATAQATVREIGQTAMVVREIAENVQRGVEAMKK